MVWPGANNQLDYCTVPDIQKYYLDGSYNDLMVTVLGLVVYLLQVTKSLTEDRMHVFNDQCRSISVPPPPLP
jgi:hypothetical protein